MPDDHYFDEIPTVGSAPTRIEVTLPDVSFAMTTDAGVFSHGRLDTGTALLLRTTPPPPSAGDLLDLGCGAGAIALTLAMRAPEARVWAVDVNERARQLCADNADRLGLDNVEVRHPDDVDDDVEFATIWSNPPIRIGKTALHDLLMRWLGRLAPDGDAWLVVQRHLGADSLQRWLTGAGFPTSRENARSGYRILRCTREKDHTV